MQIERKVIKSRQNPVCAHIRKLIRSGNYRKETGEYVADGEKMWQEAVRWKAPILQVITVEGDAETAVPQGIEHIEVPPELMAYLSPMESPQGILFTLERREWPFEAERTVRFRGEERRFGGDIEEGRYLVLDGLQDPGNVGTIWRTADALGADGIFLLNHCADPFHPKTVRASMGACFRQPLWETQLPTLLEFLGERKLELCAAALGANCQRLGEGALKGCAVVIGNEGHGISQEVLAACTRRVMIPMRERCESLNAAAAATIALWEMSRGR